MRGVLLLGLDRPLHHFAPAGSVESEHPDRQAGDGLDGLRDGVGDVVQLEVEKNLEAQTGNFLHAVGPAGGEHFQAHLNPLHRALQGTERGDDIAGRLGVEDEDEVAGHGSPSVHANPR